MCSAWVVCFCEHTLQYIIYVYNSFMFTDGLDVVGSCSTQALVDYTTAVLHVISICHATWQCE